MTAADLLASDIPWTSAPIDRIEDANTLAMTTTELLGYTASLQDESRTLRRLLHHAIAMVARQTDELATAARMKDALRRELRTRRDASVG